VVRKIPLGERLAAELGRAGVRLKPLAEAFEEGGCEGGEKGRRQIRHIRWRC
jgi:hypothetical protein